VVVGENNMSDSLIHGLTFINKDYKLVAEFGVWQGRTIKIIRETLDDSFQIFGFDSFEGMPDHTTTLKNVASVHSNGYGAKVYQNMFDRDVVIDPGVFSTNKQTPDVENVTWCIGWFDDTLPEFTKNHPVQPAALLHIDCDHYESTKTVFKNMHPYIAKDTVLVFDEWHMDATIKTPHHEQKAFYEWVKEHNIKFKFIHYTDKSAYFPEERKIIQIL
jgi:hypothetical protein